MKHLIITILLILKCLGLSAQAFTLDSSFVPNFDISTSLNTSLQSIVELPSRNIILAGSFSLAVPGKNYNNVIKINSNGSLNISFSDRGGGGDLILVDNNLLANGRNSYGFIDTNGNEVNRSSSLNYLKTVSCTTGKDFFFSDGSRIAPNGFSQTANGPCPIINPPDTFPGMYLVKVTPQGLWDSTFRAFPNWSPNGVVRYDSNRLLVYGFPGRFTHYNGVRVNGLCRIFADGSLDSTFQSPLKDTLDGDFGPVLVDSLGRIFVAGRYFLDDGTNVYKTIVRLKPNGNVDSSFNTNAAFSATNPLFSVQTIVETEDHGYLVGGSFDTYQNTQKNNIVKVDATGNLETQYFTRIGPDSSYLSSSFPNFSPVVKILKSKFGGYYVAGYFLKWDGQPSQPVVRIHGLNTTVGLEKTGLRAESRSEVLIFPNPTNGLVSIESEVEIERVEVYGLSGLQYTALTRNTQPDKSNNESILPTSTPIAIGAQYDKSHKKSIQKKQQINLANFESGIYFLKVYLKSGEVVTKKVFKT